MDTEKLVEFLPKYLSEYIHAFAATFQQPSMTYAPVSGDGSVLIGTAGSDRINPRLVTFAILSAVLGFTLRQVLPTSLLPIHVVVMVVVILWFVLSALLHLLLRLLGGTGAFVATVSAALHIFSVVYVVCNVVALLARIAALTPLADVWDTTLVEVLAYFPLQFLLLGTYMPRTLRYVHQISGWRLFLFVSVVWSAIVAVVGVVIFLTVGMPMAPPPA
jgi:hypothetical protein